MSKTTEEKIDEIHDAVINIQAEMRANKTICDSVHKAVDDRLNGMHKVIRGNGAPGLIDRHHELENRFDRLEAKIVAWVGVGSIVGSVLGPYVIGWMRK